MLHVINLALSSFENNIIQKRRSKIDPVFVLLKKKKRTWLSRRLKFYIK